MYNSLHIRIGEIYMKKFNDYVMQALSNSSLKNRAELCRILGIKQSSLYTLEHGKTIPADTTMIKLADLAGMPKEEALIDLNLWRSKNDPTRHEIWKRIAKAFVKTAAVSAFLINSANACNYEEKNIDNSNFLPIKCILCDKHII